MWWSKLNIKKIVSQGLFTYFGLAGYSDAHLEVFKSISPAYKLVSPQHGKVQSSSSCSIFLYTTFMCIWDEVIFEHSLKNWQSYSWGKMQENSWAKRALCRKVYALKDSRFFFLDGMMWSTWFWQKQLDLRNNIDAFTKRKNINEYIYATYVFRKL